MKPALTKTAPSDIQSRAVAVQARLIELYSESRRNFIETGSLVIEVEASKLWKLLITEDGTPFRSFSHWARTGLPYGKSTVLAAMDMVKKFDGIPQETLQRIPRVNLESISKLPRAQRHSDKWLQAALTMPAKDLQRALRGKGADTVLEMPPRQRYVLVYSGRAGSTFDRAIACERERRGADDMPIEKALTGICTVYLEATGVTRARAS